MERVINEYCTLYHGDAYEVLAGLDVKANAVITDPPFGITSAEWDECIDFGRFWQLAEERTVSTANYVLFGCGRFSIDLVNSKREWYRYDLIWFKNRHAGHLNSHLMPLRKHESIMVFGQPGNQGRATYNPVKVYDKSKEGKSWISNPGISSLNVYGKQKSCVTVSNGWSHPHSVLVFDRDKNGMQLHPTAKPVPLMEWLIKTYTNEDDLVIDPFMGSGSTGMACVNLNRRFIGIEKDKEYFEAAATRLTSRMQVELFM